MSRLIKSAAADQNRIRVIAGSQDFAPPEPPAYEVELARLQRDLDASQAELARRDAEVERLKQNVTDAYREGEAAGQTVGLQQAEETLDRRLALLSAGIDQALKRFNAEMAALERLAPLLAREGLERVLGDTENYRSLLHNIIQYQLRSLEAAAVLNIEVSRQDFPDSSDLAPLQAMVEVAATRISASDQLAAGACRIKLRLGGLDVGIDRQWPRLSELLQQIALPEAAR